MKKFLKWTLITVGIIVGVAVLAYVGMFLKLKHETSGFTPLPTGHVMDIIYAVQDDFANVFFVRDSLGYAVIDCGNSPEVVAKQMQTIDISPAEVHSILLTHSDTDHIGALSLFPHAKLYMAREEEQMIDGRTAKMLWFGNALPRTDYTLVDDREVFQAGGLTVQGFLAPGHTAGMMAYLMDGKYLFSGDIVALKDGKIVPIPKFFDMDHDEALRSHDIIRNIPAAEYIITGHWGWADYKTAVE
jgi:glyoxylase-like metal-dependent hydrolase (beta-lactamase superfamily II)